MDEEINAQDQWGWGGFGIDTMSHLKHLDDEIDRIDGKWNQS
jgi:hypothetical protein